MISTATYSSSLLQEHISSGFSISSPLVTCGQMRTGSSILNVRGGYFKHHMSLGLTLVISFGTAELITINK